MSLIGDSSRHHRRGVLSGIILTAAALAATNVMTPPALADADAAAANPGLTAGWGHTCGLDRLDRAHCWGLNYHGQLGDGTLIQRVLPVPVDTSGALADVRLRQLSGGVYHTCGLSTVGRAYCWGDNRNGQIGDGSTAETTTPIAVSTFSVLRWIRLTQISAGAWHTCALSRGGRAYCWGANHDGQQGDGTTIDRLTPVAVDTGTALRHLRLTQISAGAFHTCALSREGRAYCWGLNSSGQLGDGSMATRTVPIAVDTTGVLRGVRLVAIAAGGLHTCALSTAGRVYCWGDNGGQVGDGTTIDRPSPVAVDTSGVLAEATVTRIAAGSDHTCALSRRGRVYCWGRNPDGGIGDGTTTDRLSPVAVDTSGVLSGVTLVGVVAGGFHTCATARDRRVYCWGANWGALGDSTTVNRLSPVHTYFPVPPSW